MWSLFFILNKFAKISKKRKKNRFLDIVIGWCVQNFEGRVYSNFGLAVTSKNVNTFCMYFMCFMVQTHEIHTVQSGCNIFYISWSMSTHAAWEHEAWKAFKISVWEAERELLPFHFGQMGSNFTEALMSTGDGLDWIWALRHMSISTM